MDRAVIHLDADHAAATPGLIHDQVDGEIFDEELGGVAQGLPIERVQDGVAGAVGGGAGALGGALAIVGGHAAEGALVDLALFGAGEGHAPMLQLENGLGRVAAEVLDGVLIAQPVRPLDGVIHVPAPVIRTHVAERGGDAALRRNRMGAGGEDLGDAGRAQARLRAADGGAKASAASAHDHHVEGVVGDGIGFAVHAGRGGSGCIGHGVQAPRMPVVRRS